MSTQVFSAALEYILRQATTTRVLACPHSSLPIEQEQLLSHRPQRKSQSHKIHQGPADVPGKACTLQSQPRTDGQRHLGEPLENIYFN